MKTFKTQKGKTISAYSGYGLELTKSHARIGASIGTDTVVTEKVTSWGFYLYEKQTDGTFSQIFVAYYSSPGTYTKTGSDSRTYTLQLVTTPQKGTFSMYVDGLKPGTTYKWQPLMYTQLQGYVYGTYSSEFTTYTAPAVQTLSPTTDFTGDRLSVTLNGKVTTVGTPSENTKQGMLFSKSSSNLDIAHVSIGGNRFELSRNSDGTFSTTRIPYSTGTWYYRAYAYNTVSKDTVYGGLYSITLPDKPSSVSLSNSYSNPYYYSAEVGTNKIKMNVVATAPSNCPVYRYGVVYSTSNSNPTIGGSNCSVQWSTSTAFDVTGLYSNTTYYLKAVVYNAACYSGPTSSTDNTPTYEYVYGSNVRIVRTKLTCGSTLRDQDGNTYSTLSIGGLCWMNENLRSTHYDNQLNWSTTGAGTAITHKSASSSNMSSSTPYQYYPNNGSGNVSSYGLLYNWPGAAGSGVNNYSGYSNMSTSQGKNQGACPRGWHLPTQAELNTLNSALNTTTNWSSFAPQYAGYITTGGNSANFTSDMYLWGNTSSIYLYTSSSLTHGVSTGGVAAEAQSVRCVQD